MASPFPHLSSPVDLGPMRLRNRLALLPHGLFFAERGALVGTDRHVDYYAARARGGVGLVCIESSVVSRDGMLAAPLVLASDARSVAGYGRIAEAVHAHGAKVCGQLTHFGNQAASPATRSPLLGPSRLPDVAIRESAKPVDAEDMARIRRDFVSGAVNMIRAGFDAVELKVAHDGILRQFLSPLTNERDDEYGGSVENRMRFVLEVAASVRASVGHGVALGIRLCLDEYLPGGYSVDEAIAYARAFEASGLVDYLSSDAGVFGSVHMVTPPMSVPEGYAEDAIARTTAATELPVIAFGRIRRPEHAERLLAEGKAAVIGMARALIADPDIAAKAFAGHPERIRPCTACNQLCVGNSMKLLPVSCTVNPAVGYGEREPQAGTRGRVVVVGGGPAGQEAARVAAEAGCAVTLFEAKPALGGRLALAAATGGRDGWRPYLDWLASELRRLEVVVKLGAAADADAVRAEQPSGVIVACGSIAEPQLSGAIELDAFCAGDEAAPRTALIDAGAAGPALWTAALEASMRGADEVTIVTPLPAVGGDLDGATFLALYGDLNRRGVRFLTDHVATALEDGELLTINVYTGAATRVKTDLVVSANARRPATDELLAGLEDMHMITVGDALVPRDAAAAIREGQLAWQELTSVSSFGPSGERARVDSR
jgi:2,4-dienoyl-CoA reductase-like NADH-dependent reductase (Old Yellow Enzyme family)